MAVENNNSVQIAKTVSSPPVSINVNEWGGRMRAMSFNFVQPTPAGDAGSIAQLIILPPGLVRVFLPLCRIAHSALGAARTLDLGWLAYTDLNGVAVVADPNGLDDGVDVSSAGNFNPGGTVGGAETFLFSSGGGVTITAQINDATIPVAATLDGYFAYTHD